jgi:hypothetical protein
MEHPTVQHLTGL